MHVAIMSVVCELMEHVSLWFILGPCVWRQPAGCVGALLEAGQATAVVDHD